MIKYVCDLCGDEQARDFPEDDHTGMYEITIEIGDINGCNHETCCGTVCEPCGDAMVSAGNAEKIFKFVRQIQTKGE